jgi:diguanylate cyclase (GGDEF)-like protein
MSGVEVIGLRSVFDALSDQARASLQGILDLARQLSASTGSAMILFDGPRSLTSGQKIASELLTDIAGEANTPAVANFVRRTITVDGAIVGALVCTIEGTPTLTGGRRHALQVFAEQISCILTITLECLRAQRLSRRLHQAIRSANGGVWSLDVASGEFRGDSAVAQLLDWSLAAQATRQMSLDTQEAGVKQVHADFDAVLDFIHPADRAGFIYAIGRATNLGTRDRHVFRVAQAGADVKPRWLVTAFERDEAVDDGAVRFIGMMRDHSAQRAAELEVEMHQNQLETLVKDLRKSNRVDVLTGLANRMALNESLRTKTLNARTRGEWVSLLIIDIDFFKSFNDTFGHIEGDVALRQVAGEVARSTRGDDLAARFGGEEFCVLCQAEPELAAKIAERIRRAVAESSWAKRPVTVSIGVCSLQGSNVDERLLFQQADAALYRAKDTGRNRVAVA